MLPGLDCECRKLGGRSSIRYTHQPKVGRYALAVTLLGHGPFLNSGQLKKLFGGRSPPLPRRRV